jgi:CubicO group peptidase (beta-lactamase class C family)
MGALKSTAPDLLTYLDANMHPERYAAVAELGTPADTLPAAIAIDHQARADWPPSHKIALFWRVDIDGYLRHPGGDNGYTAYIAFNLQKDLALVVLYNRYDGDDPPFMGRVAENVHELLSGQSSIPLDVLSEDERRALRVHTSSDH